ncbi:vWA domain-containing protein [Olleya namhaensis]|uniref:N-terminal double-transmembrane domain-containing protein n=1 Tax=Olleya namhaensis TaxID=1144750 RepID=A0A1I3SYR3_9FLAO|nr:BatA and WFA domain-containing protein [Olleya namhaensis]SFJ62741.1 N-terminal double-transmembrane domain-containing protein [Olleya namhaensis]
MQFKNPELLYALFLLLIPIIVHLFQLRKFQKVYFTNVAALKKVQLQTRKSATIKKWLTLLTRLLLLAAIIIAFAQPYLSKTNTFNTKTETVIYLDNSFSMQAKGEKGDLLKRAVQDLIETIPETETLSLITNTESYRNTTIKAIKNELLQLDYVSNQLPYDAALLKSKKAFSSDKNTLKNLIFISDFQQKKATLNIKQDTAIAINLVQLKPVSTNNIAVDSLFISKQDPNSLELTVVLKNNGLEVKNLPISLFDNGNLLSKASVDLDGKATAIFNIPNNKIIKGKVTIEDKQLQFDNALYFNINETSKINVLAINDTNTSYLSRIFTEDEFLLTTKTTSNLDYSLFDTQNLIVIDETETLPNSLVTALKVFTDKGGAVVLIPSLKGKLSDYNTFLQRFGFAPFEALNTAEKRITTINYAHPLYANGVFEKQVDNFQYPKVNRYYPQTNTKTTAVLQFEDAKPFLSQNKSVYVFSAPINKTNSNFKNINLIVPTFYNIAKQSLNTTTLYYTIGQSNSYDVPVNIQQDRVLTLVNGTDKIIPEQNYFNNKVVIKTNDIPEKSGIYDLKNNTTILQNVSYNYNRAESNLNYINLDDVKHATVNNNISTVFENINNDTKVNELWKWFVILGLVLLIIEMLILKYLK